MLVLQKCLPIWSMIVRKLIISVLSLLIIVLGVLLIAPVFFGKALEKKYPQLVSNFSVNPNLKLEVASYNRGWFSSDAVLRATVTDNVLNSADSSTIDSKILTSFIINQKIHHGPIAAFKLKDGSWKLVAARAVAENTMQEGEATADALAVWTFANRFTAILRSPSIHVAQDNEKIDIEKIDGSINFAVNENNLKTNLKLHHLQYWEKNIDSSPLVKTIDLTGLKIFYHTSKNPNGLWYGKSLVRAENINLLTNINENNPILLKRLDLNLKQKIDAQQKTSINLLTKIQAIKNDWLNVNNFKLNLLIDNLNSQSLAKLNDSVQNNESPYSLLFDLLSAGFQLNFKDLSFNTDKGPVAFHGQLTIPSQQANGNDPLFWVQIFKKIVLTAELKVPVKELNQWLTTFYQSQSGASQNAEEMARKQIDYWTQNNIIIKQKDNYFAQLSIKEGNVLINGAKPQTNQLLIETDTATQEESPSNNTIGVGVLKPN